jgi:hypothetical protein
MELNEWGWWEQKQKHRDGGVQEKVDVWEMRIETQLKALEITHIAKREKGDV